MAPSVFAGLSALRACASLKRVSANSLRIRLASGCMVWPAFSRSLQPRDLSVRSPLKNLAGIAGLSERSCSTRRWRRIGRFPGIRIEPSRSPSVSRLTASTPWTIKNGLLHVAPPFQILARMITLRAHLDAVPSSNAPLLVAPGSHRLGRIPESEVPDVVKRCGVVACLADAGDVWVYSTPILHASEAAREPAHRRVLQVDFTADDLPGGSQWLGV